MNAKNNNTCIYENYLRLIVMSPLKQNIKCIRYHKMGMVVQPQWVSVRGQDEPSRKGLGQLLEL